MMMMKLVALSPLLLGIAYAQGGTNPPDDTPSPCDDVDCMGPVRRGMGLLILWGGNGRQCLIWWVVLGCEHSERTVSLSVRPLCVRARAHARTPWCVGRGKCALRILLPRMGPHASAHPDI